MQEKKPCDVNICTPEDLSTPLLKEYYEIVNEARPLSGFFPTDADVLTEIIMKLSKLPSFSFIIDVWKIKCCMQQFIFYTFLLLFVSHFTQVLQYFDMWYFGNRFVIETLFIYDNNLFKDEQNEKKSHTFLSIVTINKWQIKHVFCSCTHWVCCPLLFYSSGE